MISLVLFSAGLRLVRSSYIALYPFLSTLLYQLCEISLAWSIILSVVRIFTLSVVCITISIVYSHTVSFKPHSVICILGTCIVSCKHQAVSCKLSSSAVSFTHLFAQLKASLAASYMHLIGRLKTFLYQLYGFYLEQHSITQSQGNWSNEDRAPCACSPLTTMNSELHTISRLLRT